jgi:hypothetical protein
MDELQCRRCQEVKPSSHFHRSHITKTGYYYLCRLCRKRRDSSERLPRLPGDPVERFWSKVQKTDNCWLWLGKPRKDGFGHFCYMDAGKRMQTLAHRFSYQLRHGDTPTKAPVYQKCEVRLCVRPDHLFTCADDQEWEEFMAKRAARSEGEFGYE